MYCIVLAADNRRAISEGILLTGIVILDCNSEFAERPWSELPGGPYNFLPCPLQSRFTTSPIFSVSPAIARGLTSLRAVACRLRFSSSNCCCSSALFATICHLHRHNLPTTPAARLSKTRAYQPERDDIYGLPGFRERLRRLWHTRVLRRHLHNYSW